MKCTKALKAWDGGEKECCGSGEALPSTPSVWRDVCHQTAGINLSHQEENAAGLQITGRKGTLPGLRGLSFQSWKAHKTTASIFLTSVHFRTESCLFWIMIKYRHLVSQSLTVSHDAKCFLGFVPLSC